jgi:glycine dehydrogenase subunit 1
VRLPGSAAGVVEQLAQSQVLAGVPYSRLVPEAGMDDVLLVAATETTTDADIRALAKGLMEVLA